MNRAAKRFFGVGNKLLPEKVKVARACMVLTKKNCLTCEHAICEKIVGTHLDTEKECCKECVRLMYKAIYGTECKSV